MIFGLGIESDNELAYLIDDGFDATSNLQEARRQPADIKLGQFIAFLLFMVITAASTELGRPKPHSSNVDRHNNTWPTDSNLHQNSNNGLKLALLLSFPNSGTSYTLKNTRRVSNTSTASNYCGKNLEALPVFSNRTHGPHIIPESSPHNFPLHYILTKTHCFHCIECHPSEYMISVKTFQERCLTECVHTIEDNKIYEHYSLSTVGKFVHLIRSPFDNIVSRFRLHRKQLLQISGDPVEHSFNATEFRSYCKEQDDMFDKEERKSWKNVELQTIATRVLCHADWFRWVHWHNHAFEMSRRHRTNIPTFVLHYDDYRSEFNQTVQRLLDFLNMTWVQPPVDFYWKDYSDYYTEEERQAALRFVSLIASNDTLGEIKRYGFY
mmetsp:Transcript_1501/g.2334  ORF Transcript_1501/g.2334 Transcript_1501/m.2334 type:complete len:381 (-) Transcript_1501:1685-2827(-)